jgi:hypothetical protein
MPSAKSRGSLALLLLILTLASPSPATGEGSNVSPSLVIGEGDRIVTRNATQLGGRGYGEEGFWVDPLPAGWTPSYLEAELSNLTYRDAPVDYQTATGEGSEEWIIFGSGELSSRHAQQFSVPGEGEVQLQAISVFLKRGLGAGEWAEVYVCNESALGAEPGERISEVFNISGLDDPRYYNLTFVDDPLRLPAGEELYLVLNAPETIYWLAFDDGERDYKALYFDDEPYPGTWGDLRTRYPESDLEFVMTLHLEPLGFLSEGEVELLSVDIGNESAGVECRGVGAASLEFSIGNEPAAPFFVEVKSPRPYPIDLYYIYRGVATGDESTKASSTYSIVPNGTAAWNITLPRSPSRANWSAALLEAPWGWNLTDVYVGGSRRGGWKTRGGLLVGLDDLKGGSAEITALFEDTREHLRHLRASVGEGGASPNTTVTLPAGGELSLHLFGPGGRLLHKAELGEVGPGERTYAALPDLGLGNHTLVAHYCNGTAAGALALVLRRPVNLPWIWILSAPLFAALGGALSAAVWRLRRRKEEKWGELPDKLKGGKLRKAASGEAGGGRPRLFRDATSTHAYLAIHREQGTVLSEKKYLLGHGLKEDLLSGLVTALLSLVKELAGQMGKVGAVEGVQVFRYDEFTISVYPGELLLLCAVSDAPHGELMRKRCGRALDRYENEHLVDLEYHTGDIAPFRDFPAFAGDELLGDLNERCEVDPEALGACDLPSLAKRALRGIEGERFYPAKVASMLSRDLAVPEGTGARLALEAFECGSLRPVASEEGRGEGE